jgi:nicotinate-nucleotide adenylyltransferase
MIFRHELPRASPGQTVGLLGGSFDPAHGGHLHLTREALKRLRLDQVWWLVSPGNPLKAEGPAPMDRRMAQARALVHDPRVTVTDIEARLGTRYTAATLEALQRLYPQVRFVWLMGADNLRQFHLWDRWDWIMHQVPVAVFARPGSRTLARLSPAAARFRFARHREAAAEVLARQNPPAWVMLNMPMTAASSTAIRAAGKWRR